MKHYFGISLLIVVGTICAWGYRAQFEQKFDLSTAVTEPVNEWDQYLVCEDIDRECLARRKHARAKFQSGDWAK